MVQDPMNPHGRTLMGLLPFTALVWLGVIAVVALRARLPETVESPAQG
jgi:hypothetical protein